MALLRKLTTAYKHGNFSAPIHLCGTSDTLQALAVRSTDEVPLRGLCDCGSWETVCARIEKIPTQVAIEEMHEKDEERRTAFATAVVADAPVELLESMVELDKQDTKERNIMSVCNKDEMSPLALAAMHSSDTATIKLLAR